MKFYLIKYDNLFDPLEKVYIELQNLSNRYDVIDNQMQNLSNCYYSLNTKMKKFQTEISNIFIKEDKDCLAVGCYNKSHTLQTCRTHAARCIFDHGGYICGMYTEKNSMYCIDHFEKTDESSDSNSGSS